MTRKVVIHPSSRKLIIKNIMDEVRFVKAMRAVCKTLPTKGLYSPEVAAKVIEIKNKRRN